MAETRYSKDHEYIRIEGDVGTVGISDYAQGQLGDVVFVELPAQGGQVTAGQVCGEIESTKSVGELYAPLSGRVLDVNGEVDADPSLVNSDPFGAGWLVKVELDGPVDVALLDRDAYLALTGEDA